MRRHALWGGGVGEPHRARWTHQVKYQRGYAAFAAGDCGPADSDVNEQTYADSSRKLLRSMLRKRLYSFFRIVHPDLSASGVLPNQRGLPENALTHNGRTLAELNAFIDHLTLSNITDAPAPKRLLTFFLPLRRIDREGVLREIPGKSRSVTLPLPGIPPRSSMGERTKLAASLAHSASALVANYSEGCGTCSGEDLAGSPFSTQERFDPVIRPRNFGKDQLEAMGRKQAWREQIRQALDQPSPAMQAYIETRTGLESRWREILTRRALKEAKMKKRDIALRSIEKEAGTKANAIAGAQPPIATAAEEQSLEENLRLSEAGTHPALLYFSPAVCREARRNALDRITSIVLEKMTAEGWLLENMLKALREPQHCVPILFGSEAEGYHADIITGVLKIPWNFSVWSVADELEGSLDDLRAAAKKRGSCAPSFRAGERVSHSPSGRYVAGTSSSASDPERQGEALSRWHKHKLTEQELPGVLNNN